MNADCVILAAGLSSRMGQNKMMLEIDGRTVIERCIGAFYDRCSKIIVVTGKYHDEVARCVDPYSKVHIVYNERYQEGMFSSVKVGIRHVEAERFFLTPGDYPLLKAETIQRMENTAGCFISPVYKGKEGHPILLESLFIPAILKSSCISLRECLQGIHPEKRQVHVDDIGVITDIDTMEDYVGNDEGLRRQTFCKKFDKNFH